MAKLIIETFEVCLGIDAQNSNPTVFAQGLMKEDDAKALCHRLAEMAVNRQLDGALVSGRVFYVRNTPGGQSLPLLAQDRPSVRARLLAQRFSLPIFAKTTDDADGNVSYVRIGTLSSDAGI